MNQNRQEIWDRLSKKALVKGKINSNIKAKVSSWYINFIIAISAWFGAIFFTTFIIGLFNIAFNNNLEDDSIFLAIIGSWFIYIAYQSLLQKEDGFLEHFMLALSIAGQSLIIFSLFLMFENLLKNSFLILVAIFQAFLMWNIPHYIHRMINSFVMTLSISSFFYSIGEPIIPSMILIFIVAWLWMNEFNFIDRKKIEAIAYGQTIALFVIRLIYLYFIKLDFAHEEPIFDYIWFEIASIATLLYIVWVIFKESKIEYSKNLILLLIIGIGLLAFISFKVTGLVFGVIFLLIGFAHSNRMLLGLGILSSISFLSYYYYYLGDTLLDKAKILALMGFAVLLSRWIMNKVLGSKLDA